MQNPPTHGPELSFLSLFVPDLAQASRDYQKVLGIEPAASSGTAIAEHPFADGPPVVFILGSVALALYQSDGKTTHPGDVGIGLNFEPAGFSERAATVRGTTLWGPKKLAGEQRRMCVTMLPDRHFFEVVGPSEPDTSS